MQKCDKRHAPIAKLAVHYYFCQLHVTFEAVHENFMQPRLVSLSINKALPF